MTASPHRIPLILAVAAATLLVMAAPSAAHTYLESSEPGNEDVVTEPLEQIVLQFNQAVNQSIGDLEVTAPDGTTLGEGPVQIDGAIVQREVAPLHEHGRYTVAWRIVAEDGHPMTGEVVFDYEGPLPGPEPEPTPTPDPTVEAATPEAETPAPHTPSPDPEPTAEHTDDEMAAPAPGGTPEDEDVAMSPTGVTSDPPRGRLGLTAAVVLALLVAAAMAVRSLRRWEPTSAPGHPAP